MEMSSCKLVPVSTLEVTTEFLTPRVSKKAPERSGCCHVGVCEYHAEILCILSLPRSVVSEKINQCKHATCNSTTMALELEERFAMLEKGILRQWLGEYVSYLVFGVNWQHDDRTVTYMLSKMMVDHVDVLGPGSKLR